VIGAGVAAIAAAAPLLGRPLKWAEDRAENFLGAYQGRGVHGEVELALAADGRMLAVRTRIVADLGAYLLTTTAIPPHTAAMLSCGCYAIDAAAVEVIGVRTNKVPTGPYRGAGRPEAIYLIERTVDAAARELGVDPVELRRRNLITDFPHETPLGWTYDSGDYGACLDLALELAGPDVERRPDRLYGRGVAMLVERAGGQFESAEAEVDPRGQVVIASGSSPHGQGHDTTFAQIAADRLGVEIGQVELRFGDTDVVPHGIGTFASRSVAMGGSALVLAVDELISRGRALAAVLADRAPEEVEYANGRFTAGPLALTWGELAAAAADPERRPPGFEPRLGAAARFESDMVFSSGAYVATIEVDPSTGVTRVLRLAAVDDAGVVINPLLTEGQVIGASAQGLGESLLEEAVYDEEGQLRTASFADYSLPTAGEIPPIATGSVSSPTPLNPLGAKGVGEGGAIGTPAAVANALADALGGDGIDPPFHEDRVWRALQDRGGG
jgi:aerobic carbon-monoxide dehydrogenase large subunit